MRESDAIGREKLVKGYPWFSGKDQYAIPAYSEFMPPSRVGRSPYGGLDDSVFAEDDHFGWHVSEVEEDYELQPALSSLAHQITEEIIKLGHGKSACRIGGQEGRNLEDNICHGI